MEHRSYSSSTHQESRNRSLGNQLLWSLFLRQLFFVTVMNFVLGVVLFLGMFLWVEHSIHQVAEFVDEHGFPSEETVAWMDHNIVTFTELDRPIEGIQFEGRLPLPSSTEKGLRNFETKNIYSVEFESNHGNYALTMNLTHFDLMFHISVFISLFLETFLLFVTLFGSNESVRRTLRPLQDLAATAVRLNSSQNFTQVEMDTLAGELDKINATHLDSRISLPSTHKELKALALAINSMLDRVTDAYEAQMRFVSDASHELRTPIAVIQGYSAMLDRWGKSDPEILQESIDAIHGESKSMERLIEQLLFLARGDNQSQPVHKHLIPMYSICQEVLKEEQMIFTEHILMDDLEEDCFVIGDPVLIKQLLRILVDNSLKYTPVGGRVWLKMKKINMEKEVLSSPPPKKNGKQKESPALSSPTLEERVEITVLDEGMGIPPSDVSHIFQRFYRTDESRTRQTGGTGLGLSIAFWIASQHDSWFEVTSREEIGTKITFYLHSAHPSQHSSETA